MKLANATDITDEIYTDARKLFQESWKGQPLRLIGVSLTGLTDDSFEQLSFFEDTCEKERRQKLDAALDSIRIKFGNDKVTRASLMNSNTRIGRKARDRWKMRGNEALKRGIYQNRFPILCCLISFILYKNNINIQFYYNALTILS